MGGVSYDRDVYSSGNSYSSSGFHSSSLADHTFSVSDVRGLDKALLPKNRTLECSAKTGIVIALDVTGSMGDSVKLLYDKLPMLWGQIEQQGYLKDFSISFAAVGDCNSDAAPFQVCDFAEGKKLDKGISKMYLEKGGGGQQCESYEMLAYFYANNVRFTHPKADKPFFFLIGDEAPYPQLSAGQIEQHFGDRVQSDIDTKKVFDKVRQKYHFKHLHVPYSSGSQPPVDQSIQREWKKTIDEDFIKVSEPKSVVDTILGIIAILNKARSLDEYKEDMRNREQTESRIKNVANALEGIEAEKNTAKSSKSVDTGSKKGRGKSTRL